LRTDLDDAMTKSRTDLDDANTNSGHVKYYQLFSRKKFKKTTLQVFVLAGLVAVDKIKY
jgi:hypothetical protein